MVLTVFVCNFCITLTYDLWMLAILKNTFFICNLCSYSTVKHDAFQWLQFLQLFTAIQCSGTLQYSAVEHCMQWVTVTKTRLQSFDCTSTAKSLQRFAVYTLSKLLMCIILKLFQWVSNLELSCSVNVFPKDWRTLNFIKVMKVRVSAIKNDAQLNQAL